MKMLKKEQHEYGEMWPTCQFWSLRRAQMGHVCFVGTMLQSFQCAMSDSIRNRWSATAAERRRQPPQSGMQMWHGLEEPWGHDLKNCDQRTPKCRFDRFFFRSFDRGCVLSNEIISLLFRGGAVVCACIGFVCLFVCWVGIFV